MIAVIFRLVAPLAALCRRRTLAAGTLAVVSFLVFAAAPSAEAASYTAGDFSAAVNPNVRVFYVDDCRVEGRDRVRLDCLPQLRPRGRGARQLRIAARRHRRAPWPCTTPMAPVGFSTAAVRTACATTRPARVLASSTPRATASAR